ncbi:MAG: VOC family protein [Actinomycetota bacterium]
MHGRFCWYELMADDVDSAAAFYGRLMGWRVAPAPGAEKPYLLFSTDDGPVAGLMERPEECRRPGPSAAWTGYVAVDEADDATARAESLGAVVRFPVTPIPGVGRFSVVSDPQGAALALFQPADASHGPPPGAVAWHELWAGNAAGVFGFYHGLFGWTEAETMDMGEMGAYRLFAIDGVAVGGMFDKPAAVPHPFWLFYFAVDDIDAAGVQVQAGGGHVVNGPMEVPGGGWILHCADPQGAMFALHGMRPA